MPMLLRHLRSGVTRAIERDKRDVRARRDTKC